MKLRKKEDWQNQPNQVIQVDNHCCANIVNGTMLAKQRTVAIKYHWVKEEVDTANLRVTWQPGTTNLADFFTKALPISKFEQQRGNYVQDLECKDGTYHCANHVYINKKVKQHTSHTPINLFGNFSDNLIKGCVRKQLL